MGARRRLETSIARRRGSKVLSFGAKAARWYVRSYDNFDYESDTNGERWLVEQVVRPGSVVFDVGANIGDWTAMVAGHCNGAIVHAFEIVPDTAKLLRDRVSNQIVVNDFGLLDQEGTAEVQHLPTFAAGSSIFTPIHSDVVELVQCRITTGDLYCAGQELDRIDLLKIDVEGADHLVLAGFTGMLGRDAIDVVQFEYGMTSIVTRFFLTDFYSLLSEAGFVIGKLFPDHVDFKEYDHRQEDLRGPNFVAVRREKAELVARLSPTS